MKDGSLIFYIFIISKTSVALIQCKNKNCHDVKGHGVYLIKYRIHPLSDTFTSRIFIITPS